MQPKSLIGVGDKNLTVPKPGVFCESSALCIHIGTFDHIELLKFIYEWEESYYDSEVCCLKAT